MSYIITATVYLGELETSERAVQELVRAEPRIGIFSRKEEDETITLSMSSAFDISHSY